MTAVITISSGSSQSGKSLISANLAHYLASKGHRTALLSVGSRQPLWEVPPIATWPNVIAGRLPLGLWGSIAYDAAVERWDALRRPLADIVPHSKIIKDIRVIGDRLLAEQPPENQSGQLMTFWREFNQYLQQLPMTPVPPPLKPEADLTPDGGGTPKAIDNPSGSRTRGNQAAALENVDRRLNLILEELRTIRRLLESRHSEPDERRGHE